MKKYYLLILITLVSLPASSTQILFNSPDVKSAEVFHLSMQVEKMSKNELIAQLYIGQLAIKKLLLKNISSFCRVPVLGWSDSTSDEKTDEKIEQEAALDACKQFLIKEKEYVIQTLNLESN